MRERRVDPAADRAAYRQVADYLRQDIASGHLAPGQRIPAEWDLCEEFHVSRNTVRQALTLLRAEGLIETARPTGSRVRNIRERAVVDVPPGARIRARPATEDERRRLGFAEGAWVQEVSSGGETRLYAADSTELHTTGDEPGE